MKTKTFVMIKPGAVHRGLIGEIVTRFETRGLNIIAMKVINVTKEQAMEHYAVHKEKPFYQDLVDYLMSGPVVVMVIKGENVIELVRHMAGDTNPIKALPGTIRGDYSADIQNNIVHTSDSPESAQHEIGIYFSTDEILDYRRVTNVWANHE